jgi:surface polysaccharide O-acyltransferase-like enzyme
MLKPPRLLWPDLVRAVAICLVIIIHVCGSVLNVGYNGSGRFTWWFSALLSSFARCGVPLFFMSSGALLLDKIKGDTVGAFFVKRMSRIVVPFLAWSIAYLIMRAIRGNVQWSVSTFLTILQGPVYYHLWFFYAIIGLYIVTPLFKFADKQIFRYVALVWIIIGPAMFFLSRVAPISFNNNFRSVFPTYVGYFVMGYLLKDAILKKRLALILSAVFLIYGIGTAVGFTFQTIHNGGAQDGFFLDFLNLNVMAGSISLFCLLRALGEKIHGIAFKKSLQLISACSLGIFAVHPMILELLASGNLGLRLTAAHGPVIIGTLLTFAVVLLVSTGITLLISKVPALNRIV